MDRWIRDLINQVSSGLSKLIDAVAQRISWVYTVFITFFIKVRTAYDRFVSGLQHGLNSLIRLGTETLNTLRWVVFTRIPQVVNSAVSGAINYLLQQIANVHAFLQGVINGLSSWIGEQINRIDAWLNSVINWASQWINSIWDTLTRIRDIVLSLLTDPARLATWLVEAILMEALRWVDRNADKLFSIFRQRAIAYTLRFADRIEDMLARLL